MAYATGTRLAAAFFCMTGIGIPIGLWLFYIARKKEKKAERDAQDKREMRENIARHYPKE